DIGTVTLWYEGRQVGQAAFVGSMTTATATIASTVTLPQDTDVVLNLKASFPFPPQKDIERVIVNLVDGPSTQATGQSSGSLVNASGSTSFIGVTLLGAASHTPPPVDSGS